MMEASSRRSTRTIKHTLKLKETKQYDLPEAVNNVKTPQKCQKQTKSNTESEALRKLKTKSQAQEMKTIHVAQCAPEAITESRIENKSRLDIKSVTVSAIRVRLNDTIPNTEEQTRKKRKTTSFNKDKQKSHTDNCVQLNKDDDHDTRSKIRKVSTLEKMQTSLSKHNKILPDVKYNPCKQARKRNNDRQVQSDQKGKFPGEHDVDVNDLGEELIVDMIRTKNEKERTQSTIVDADLSVDTNTRSKADKPKRKRTVPAVMEGTDTEKEGDTCTLDSIEPLSIEGGIVTDQSSIIDSNSDIIYMPDNSMLDIKSEDSFKGKVIHIKVSDSLIGPNKSMFKEDGSCIDEDYLKNKYQNSKPLLEIIVKRENLDMINTGDEINIADNRVKNEMDENKTVQQDVDVVDGEESDISESEGELSEYDEEEKMNSATCPVCSKVYSCKSNLMKHQALHNDVKPFQCEICGMSFVIKSYLKAHKVMHSGKRILECGVCGKTFLRRSGLNSHKKSHSDVKAFSCNTCGKMFKTKSGKVTHMKEHDDRLGYVCHLCGKSYGLQSYLTKHLSVHAGEKPFRCTECNKSFPYNQSLQEHLRRHAGEKPEVCDKCGMRYNNKRQLKAHMKYHNNVLPFACLVCSMFYESQQSLNKHITKSHNRKYECDHCHHSFVNKKHLRTHQRSEHKDLVSVSRRIPISNLAKSKKCVCSLCNREFFNRYVLTKHVMSKHQLSEVDVKSLLQIRKKALSKKQMDKYNLGEGKADISKAPENDNDFRVYYKDDEMAVYVKGTDNFDQRLEGMTRDDNAEINQVEGSQGVRYIVLEDSDLNDFTELSYVDADRVINLKEGAIQTFDHSSLEVKGDDSNIGMGTEEVGEATSDQNYYVVYTDSNENPESAAEELGQQVLVPKMNDDGTERIVLILNEGEDGKPFMLENGEQYEIVSQEDNRNITDGYEVIATGPDFVSGDFIEKDLIEPQAATVVQTVVGSDRYLEINTDNIQAGEHNIRGLEQVQRQDIEHHVECHGDGIVVREDINVMSQAIKKGQRQILAHLRDGLVEIGGANNTQYQPFQDSRKVTLGGESCITQSTIIDNDTTNAIAEGISNFDARRMQVSEESLEGMVPKKNTVQEFESFENALKLKLGDFQNQVEYNNFLDRMIQTLQQAKHSVPK